MYSAEAYENCPAKSEIEAFKQWQERQNGSLQRIEAKVDKLFFAIISGSVSLILALVGAILALR